MKKTSLLSALTVSTMLTACGGGGGGHGNIPNTTLPDIPNQPSVTQDSITTMNYSVSNADDRIAYAKSVLGDEFEGQAVSSTSMFRLRNAPPTDDESLTEMAYSNMNEAINEDVFDMIKNGDFDDGSSEDIQKRIRRALRMAGVKDAFELLWDDIKNLISDDNKAKNIFEYAERISNRYGRKQEFNISNAKLQLVKLHEDQQNSYVNLTEENNVINGIEVLSNKGMAGELSYSATRDGAKDVFKTEKRKIYRYGINSRYYTGTFFDTFDKLSSEEIQEKLKQRVDELASTGAYDTDEAPRDEIVARIKKAIEIAFDPDLNDGSMIVTEYEGDARSLDSQSEIFEYFHTDYDKEEKITYKSYMTSDDNKNKDMKLAYSDFGILTKDSKLSKEVMDGANKETYVFAGGYDSKKIEAQDIAENMNFSGYAYGAVNVGYSENEGAETYNEVDPLELNGKIDLLFDATNGTQTATASFDNWYDVKASSDAYGSNATLTLTNWKNGTADDFKFRGQNEYVVDDFTTAKQLAADPVTATEANNQQHSDPAFGAFNIGYYGDAGVPSEATGYIFYEEARGYNKEGMSKEEFIAQYGQEKADDFYDSVKNIGVNIGFGAVRQ